MAGHHPWSKLRDQLAARVGEEKFAEDMAAARAEYERLERSHLRRLAANTRPELRALLQCVRVKS